MQGKHKKAVPELKLLHILAYSAPQRQANHCISVRDIVSIIVIVDTPDFAELIDEQSCFQSLKNWE